MTERKLVPCADCGKPEEWRDVPGYVGAYQVSNHGRVKSLARLCACAHGGVRRVPERILKPGVWSSGHLFVIIQVDCVKMRWSVHRLALVVFKGECPDGMEALHSDDVATHNHPANLSWGTRAQNFDDARRHGTTIAGRHGTTSIAAKLTAEDVRAIRAATHLSQYVLAKRYGVTPSRIWYIRNRRGYRDVED